MRHLKGSLSWRRARGVFLVIAMLGGVVAFGTPANAVHDEGFALQGDVDHTSLLDWVDMFNVSGTGVATPKSTLAGGFFVSAFKADYALPDTSAYATGSKDDLPINAAASDWQCKKSNNVGDKFDLLNAYTAALRPTSGASQGDLIVYFGSEISAPEGNRNAGLWLLQDKAVDCSSTAGGNQSWTGHHVDGDVFIVSAFTNGGSQANITVYEWVDTVGANNDDIGGSLQLKFGTADANKAPNDFRCVEPNQTQPEGDVACATDNSTAEVDPPWTAPDKDGGNLNIHEFFEGAVNLSDLGLDTCFSTAVANSRSSQEPGSTLHDFARMEFPTCNPSSTMQNTAATASPATVHAGETTTLTFYDKNDGDIPLTNNSVTTDDAGCNATIAYSSGDTNTNNILDPGETWAFTCTTSFTGTGTKTVTAIGTGTSPLGVVTFCATPDPTKICDAEETASVTVTLVNPSTELTKTASALITYTFKEKNTGDVALDSPSINDPNCSSTPAYQSGDTNTNGKLDVTETWTFTCTQTLNGPTADTGNATVTNAAVAHGTDNTTTPRDVTFCPVPASPPAGVTCSQNERDRVTVTIQNLARGAG